MAGTQGVIFQTVPEELAQAVDLLSQRFQLPSDVILKSAISMLVAELNTNPIRVERFMDLVRADFERGIVRVLA